MIYLCAGFSLVWLLVIISPFFRNNWPSLASGQNISNLKTLANLRHKILEQYLRDEKIFLSNFITKSEWSKRQDYLASKFVDCVRRLEFLQRKE